MSLVSIFSLPSRRSIGEHQVTKAEDEEGGMMMTLVAGMMMITTLSEDNGHQVGEVIYFSCYQVSCYVNASIFSAK